MLGAVVLPIGPLAVAILRFVLPYTTNQPADAVVREVAAHQGAQNAVVWLGFLAVLTLVPGVIYAGRVVGRTAPRLAAVATILLVLGYISLAWLTVGDAYLLFGVRHHLPAATLVAMYNGVHPAASVAAGLFVAGHVLGTILLGIAMLRGRVVPLGGHRHDRRPADPLRGGGHRRQPRPRPGRVGPQRRGFRRSVLALLRLTDDQWAPAPVGH